MTNRSLILIGWSINWIPIHIIPNIPTKEDILELCVIFWCIEERIEWLSVLSGWTWEIFIKNKTSKNWDNIELKSLEEAPSWYFSGIISDDELQGIWKKLSLKIDYGTSHNFQILSAWNKFPRDVASRIFSKILSTHKNGFNPNIKNPEAEALTALILLVKISDRLPKSKVFWEVFDNLVLSWLTIPYYFITTTPEIRKRFLSLIFQSSKLQEELKNPESFLWKYLLRIFWADPYLHTKYAQVQQKSLEKNDHWKRNIDPKTDAITSVKAEVIDSLENREEKHLLSDWEIRLVCGFFHIPYEIATRYSD